MASGASVAVPIMRRGCSPASRDRDTAGGVGLMAGVLAVELVGVGEVGEQREEAVGVGEQGDAVGEGVEPGDLVVGGQLAWGEQDRGAVVEAVEVGEAVAVVGGGGGGLGWGRGKWRWPPRVGRIGGGSRPLAGSQARRGAVGPG